MFFLFVASEVWGPADLPVSSFQLLIAGGAVVLLLACLFFVRRKNRVVLERSPLTDEMIIYLSRIADALEGHQRPTAQMPSTDQLVAEVVRRLEEISQARNKVRPIPSSIFGREYSPTTDR